jgi:hypothetical protein
MIFLEYRDEDTTPCHLDLPHFLKVGIFQYGYPLSVDETTLLL